MRLILAVLLLSSSFCYSEIWVVNPDHSELSFEIPFLSVSHVSGRFNRFKGIVDLVENKPTHISFSVQAASISTSNNMRDGHLKGNDFLATRKFPYINFESYSVIQKTENKFIVKGKLQIKDVVEEIAVPVQISIPETDGWGYTNRFLSFETTIKRSLFGVNWNKTVEGDKFLIGDNISIKGNFQVQPQGELTPKSKFMIPVTKFTQLKEKLNRGELATKEFNQMMWGTTKDKTISEDQSDTPTSDIARESAQSKVVAPLYRTEHTVYWKIAFFILSAVGFLGIVIIPIYFKQRLLKHYRQKYTETGWIGMLSDIPVLLVIMAYTWAVWVVGWEF